MNKLTIHGDILQAVETLERTTAKFREYKQYGTERLRHEDIAEMRALLKRADRARKDINEVLTGFYTIAEPVDAATPNVRS